MYLRRVFCIYLMKILSEPFTKVVTFCKTIHDLHISFEILKFDTIDKLRPKDPLQGRKKKCQYKNAKNINRRFEILVKTYISIKI